MSKWDRGNENIKFDFHIFKNNAVLQVISDRVIDIKHSSNNSIETLILAYNKHSHLNEKAFQTFALNIRFILDSTFLQSIYDCSISIDYR